MIAESGRKPANLTWILNHEIRAFVFSQDGGERWIVHYKIPEGVDWKTVHHEKVLNTVFGKPVPFEIISSGPWAGGLALVADQYQAERVFFVGDAAHLFTPLGGFGMNTGIGDAINVCWKLAAMFEGWGGPSLLDTYGAERRPIGLRNSRLGVKCSQRKGEWQLPPNIEDADEAGEPMREASELQVLAGTGLKGDRYATGRGAYSQTEPGKIRHLSLITQDGIETARQWQESAGLRSFTMAQTRRNVLLHNLTAALLNSLVGKRFKLGEIECYGIELCTPCPRPAELSSQPGFQDAFDGRGGLRAQVLGTGWLRLGDPITW